ncbi:hypothetical protein [Marinobacter sp. LV10MA510-1]|uniref:hypothetical protein n=1 Tax=Marinobacter sp. LV10MA510-1 TaxID=1415567 RepID=UPI0015CF281B|nr:hypothetical protein [Marinobacter sp. LV10MA510-1]
MTAAIGRFSIRGAPMTGPAVSSVWELQTFNRVTLRESIESVRQALWDEDKRRLVSFREASVGSGIK